MLDDRMRMMLEAANTLTEEDLEFLCSDGASITVATSKRTGRARAVRGTSAATNDTSACSVVSTATPTPPERVAASQTSPATGIAQTTPASVGSTTGSLSRGEYERGRTRESKVSTTCLGTEREKHEWWPLGTTVVGQIGPETFTAEVVENPQVKSGRSLKITSGTEKGTICITPTRAAMVATESYRQARYMGRGAE